MRAMLVFLVGCGSTPPESPRSTSSGTRVVAPAGAQSWIARHLTLQETRATRVSWVLTLDGDRADLVGRFEVVDAPTAIEHADQAAWRLTETRTEVGPVRDRGDSLALDLSSPSDSMFLRCWKHAIVVASAGARLIARPGPLADCRVDNGVWRPAAQHRVDAWICGHGDALDDGQRVGIDGQQGALDETLLRFGVSPGIEVVDVLDGCYASSGLRIATPVAPRGPSPEP